MGTQAKKLVALDLDGTALSDRHIFSPATLAVFERIKKAGHVLCFVSGRRYVDMLPLGEQGTIAHYSILNSGAQVLDNRSGAGLLEHLVPPDVAKAVIRHCLENRYLLNICAREYWAVNYVDPGVRSYGARIGREPDRFQSPEQVPLDRIEGFTATVGGEKVVEYIRSQGFDLYCVQSEPGSYDITPGGFTKWDTLQWLARRLEIPVERILAAGNYYNDLDMIRGAGVGVAVGNALPEVKAAADYVTRRTNDQDAVVEIAETFLL